MMLDRVCSMSRGRLGIALLASSAGISVACFSSTNEGGPKDGGVADGTSSSSGGGSDSGSGSGGSSGGSTDPYFSDVVLLMHFDGPDGGTTFTDVIGHTVSSVGSAEISTATAEFGGASGLFSNPSGGAYLTVPSSPDWDLASGDSTLEMWVNAISYPSHNPVLIGQSPMTYDAQWLLYVISDGQLGAQNNGGANDVEASVEIGVNSWHHVACVRSSGKTLLFVDGVLGASSPLNPYTSTTNPLYIAAGNSQSNGSMYFWDGYIDELRITKGVARYTSNFTPPTQAFPNQ
jgi:hypothetical protein